MQGIFLNPLCLLKLKSWIWEGNFLENKKKQNMGQIFSERIFSKAACIEVKWTETTGLKKIHSV